MKLRLIIFISAIVCLMPVFAKEGARAKLGQPDMEAIARESTDENAVQGRVPRLRVISYVPVSAHLKLGPLKGHRLSTLYYIELNYATRALRLTQINTIGIIGGFNGWGNSNEMAPSEDLLTWTITQDMTEGDEWKIRMNNDRRRPRRYPRLCRFRRSHILRPRLRRSRRSSRQRG